MDVKAQGLLHGAAWLRDTYGEAGLEKVLAACSADVRKRWATASAGSWIPQVELVEFLTVADRSLGAGDGTVAEAMGAASARANLRHMALRLAFFLGNTEFVMRRVARVWREHNEGGQMIVHDFVKGRMTAELADQPNPDWFLCCSVSGWLNEAGLATGMKGLVTRHVDCRGRGDARCTWELRWGVTESSPPPAR